MSGDFQIQNVKDGQPSLFPEDELLLLTLDKPEVRKRYTAESLERNEAKRGAILRALAEGHGLLRIAKAFGVSHHLVSALRDSRPDLVAIEKKQLSGQIGRILKMSADRYEEALAAGAVPVGQIPVSFGIFSDKKTMLDGDASMVIEHRHTVQGGTVDDFEAKLAKLRSAGSDIASRGNLEKAQQKEISQVIDVVSDAVNVGPGGGSEQAGQTTSERAGGSGNAASGPAANGAEGGGGGCGFCRG